MADDFLRPERLRDPFLERYGMENTPASFGEGWSAAFEDSMVRNPAPSLSRWLGRQGYEGYTDEFGNEQPAFKQSRMLTAEEANTQYGIKGHLKFDKDTPEAIAQELRTLKQQEIERQTTMMRAGSGIGTSLSAGLVASFLDPLNIASAFIPVVGPARFAAMAAKIGAPAARVATGAIEGAVGAALLEPIVYGVAQQEQADYDMADSLLNITFGTALGAGLHFGAGYLGDRLKAGAEATPAQRIIEDMPRADQEALLRTAVADVLEGRPVDVSAVVAASASERTRLLSSAAAIPDPNLTPDVRFGAVVDKQTTSALDLIRQTDPGLAARVDSITSRQESYRQWIDDLREKNAAEVSKSFDDRIAEVEQKAQGKNVSARRVAEYERIIETLRAEKATAVDAARRMDTPDTTRLRTELQNLDYDLRDMAVEITAARERAEAGMAQAGETVRGIDSEIAAAFREAEARRVRSVQEAVAARSQPYFDPEGIEASAAATRVAEATTGAPKPTEKVATEIDAMAKDAEAVYRRAFPERELPDMSDIDEELGNATKAFEAIAACRITKG